VKQIVRDDIYQLRAIVSKWIADENINAIITTGGTGFTQRDNTPEALRVLFDKDVEGFGELFRHVSYAEIGTSTIQSRAFAGFANHTVIFSVPGSTNACKTAWDKLIAQQLDASHRPCNFVTHLKVTKDQSCRSGN
jgi:molybdenum cofactor biosynthesis protein B